VLVVAESVVVGSVLATGEASISFATGTGADGMVTGEVSISFAAGVVRGQDAAGGAVVPLHQGWSGAVLWYPQG